MAGTKMGVVGCGGRMGRMLVAEIAATEGCSVAGGSEAPGSGYVNQDIGELAGIGRIGIPIGEIYTSRLNRAIETGKLLSDKEVKPVDALTDSGAGSASAMANPGGGNAKAGLALRELVNAAPKAGTNTLMVTHKTNIADAFGKEASDVQEGEAFVYRSGGSAPAAFVTRVKPAFWIDQAAN